MPESDRIEKLFNALSRLKSPGQFQDFFADLCTPAEIAAMADRWHVACLLHDGLPYRRINELTGVSTATVTRVARCLTYGSGGYATLLRRDSKVKETKR